MESSTLIIPSTSLLESIGDDALTSGTVEALMNSTSLKSVDILAQGAVSRTLYNFLSRYRNSHRVNGVFLNHAYDSP